MPSLSSGREKLALFMALALPLGALALCGGAGVTVALTARGRDAARRPLRPRRRTPQG